MSVTVDFDWDVAGDAELVCAAAAGDRAAFAGIYDRYADRLYDFCMGMVGDRDAADCVQEAFCMAAVDLPSLRDPQKLRPWLYSIARHQALRTLRARKRETIFDEMPDEPSLEAGPDALAARNELAALVTQAEGGCRTATARILNLPTDTASPERSSHRRSGSATNRPRRWCSGSATPSDARWVRVDRPPNQVGTPSLPGAFDDRGGLGWAVHHPLCGSVFRATSSRASTATSTAASSSTRRRSSVLRPCSFLRRPGCARTR